MPIIIIINIRHGVAKYNVAQHNVVVTMRRNKANLLPAEISELAMRPKYNMSAHFEIRIECVVGNQKLKLAPTQRLFT